MRLTLLKSVHIPYTSCVYMQQSISLCISGSWIKPYHIPLSSCYIRFYICSFFNNLARLLNKKILQYRIFDQTFTNGSIFSKWCREKFRNFFINVVTLFKTSRLFYKHHDFVKINIKTAMRELSLLIKGFIFHNLSCSIRKRQP